MKNFLFSFALFSLTLLTPAFAHCPLCTAATGAAVAATRFYGVDDLAVGVFIGGFILSTSFWFDRILRKRNKNNEYIPLQGIVLTLSGLVLTILTFVWGNLVGSDLPSLFGINKLILGTVVGTVVAFGAFEFHKILRSNLNKNIIPYQGIVFTLFSLILVNIGFYFAGWL